MLEQESNRETKPLRKSSLTTPKFTKHLLCVRSLDMVPAVPKHQVFYIVMLLVWNYDSPALSNPVKGSVSKKSAEQTGSSPRVPYAVLMFLPTAFWVEPTWALFHQNVCNSPKGKGITTTGNNRILLTFVYPEFPSSLIFWEEVTFSLKFLFSDLYLELTSIFFVLLPHFYVAITISITLFYIYLFKMSSPIRLGLL